MVSDSATMKELTIDLNIKLLEIVRDLMIALGIVSFLFVYNSL